MKVRPAGDCVWEIPPSQKPGMRVPARIFASEALLAGMDAGVFEQVTQADEGIISPGGIGFDINCGMRVLRTRLTEPEVRDHLAELVDQLFAAVPSGVGAQASSGSPTTTSRRSWSRARAGASGADTARADASSAEAAME
jgi:tRNA-splicing ligase RtcB